MYKQIFILIVFLINFNLFSQEIKLSGDKLLFNQDSTFNEITVYNIGSDSLTIDSIYSKSKYYIGYNLEIILKDTTIYYLVFIGDWPLNFSIESNDSAKLIFNNPSCPICKTSSKLEYFTDTIVVHSNSLTNDYTYIFAEGERSTDVKDENISSNDFKLYQNYPNPFNSDTKIRYDLPENLFVNFRLYDCLGNTLIILVNESQGPGAYSVEINTTNLASGIYFYRLIAGKFDETRKMIVLK